MKRRIGILTSGGDTPGMNAGIRSVVMAADAAGFSVMGITKGYAGLIDGRVDRIKTEDVDGIVQKGGTILKTARCEDFKTEEGQKKALQVIKAFDISGLVVIGGDGSFQGARVLSHLGVPTIGIPGTIDNDLAYTDFTIGFDTAVNGVIQEMSRIRDTMESHERVGVIEVMGNKCGDIALYAALAGGAEHLMIPEIEFDIDYVCEKIIASRIKGKMTSIVLIAEGAGKGEAVANYMKAKASLDAKAIVLGYIQRGGNPTMADRFRATRMGAHAVQLLNKGIGNRVVGIRDNQILDEDIDEALSREIVFPVDLYEEYKIMSENQK
ncbi:6-phosphofructokinase [Christensenellaceae bacterium OttesenSCG-928-K19]|nr:6-phosphofructokinase [Christensenellaceae bacterium OttesenSCG-928-K19]